MSKKAQIRSEKDLILAVLAREKRYLAPSEITELTGLTLKPHAIRDRLKNLVEEGQVTKSGVVRGTKYKIVKSHTAKIQIRPPKAKAEGHGEATIPLTQPAKTVHEYVTLPLQNRSNVGFNRDFLGEYRPNTSSYLTDEDKETLLGLGQVEEEVQPAGTYARKILDRLLIDLSFNSSRLEGNTYSLLDTERLIQDGAPAEGKDAQETQMILNHKGAIEFLVDPSGQIGFNRFAITNLHAHLSENLLGNPAAEGRLRTIPVDIGRSVYVPTAIPQLIEECFDLILARARQIQNPYEQAFFVLVHLPYLQPFDDVNKRVARLAANIPLIRNNLCPLSFIDVPKKLYIEALLGVYEINDVALLKDVFMWAYRRSASRYKVIQESLGTPDPINLQYRDLIKRGVKELVEAGIKKTAASNAIKQLLSTEVESSERNDVVHAIERELISLHEGNIARFKLDLHEFRKWKAEWENF
jgi:Fic family protein